MKSKNDTLDEIYQEKKPRNLIFIFLIFLVLLLLVLLIFSISIKNKTIKNLKNQFQQLQQKDLEIENIKKQLNNLNSEKGVTQNTKKLDGALTPVDREYLFDKEFFKKYNMNTENNLNKLGYETVMQEHSLEKGMGHFELRPFAVQKTAYIIRLIKRQTKYDGFENKFTFINGINSLRAYKTTYEEHKWTNKFEYKKVSEFLKDYEKVPEHKAGAYILTKQELEKDYKIDYIKFIKSRHSTRNYKHEPLKIEDVQAAVEMAKYSASPCNRQYIKLHYYPTGEMRQNVINYALGKGELYLEGVSTFIVTFDVNGLGLPGERNQGYIQCGALFYKFSKRVSFFRDWDLLYSILE